jgi:Do/DeqQ family serine protease
MKLSKYLREGGKLFLILIASFKFYGMSYANTPGCPGTGPVSYADAVALAAPAVVSIKTTKEISLEVNPLLQDPLFRQFFGDQGELERGQEGNGELPKETQQGIGSGVIVNDKGYILTNHHVIKAVDTVIVTLADGRTAEAKVIGIDPDTDLAVVQIKLDKLPIIPMGSSQKLRVGDVVLAIGNPFGLDKTVTQGIVSATERPGADIGILENLIQTDAAINPGNSGGALIDACGRIVGINTAIFTRSGGYQGIGFAVPIDQATNVMNQLIEGKHIKRGFLGVTLQSLNKEISDQLTYKGEGVFVRAIVRGSPAQKAGVLPGDVIVKINNVAVKDDRMAQRLVTTLTPGQSYPFEIYRKGDILTFTIVLGERKQPVLNKTKGNEQQEPQKK